MKGEEIGSSEKESGDVQLIASTAVCTTIVTTEQSLDVHPWEVTS